MAVVRDDVPAVPVSYGTSFSLVRDGLAGAATTGTGILRLAGLAWEDRAVSATVGLRGLPRLLAAALLAAAALLPAVASPARAADVTFGTPGADVKYTEGITFTVPLTASVPLERVEIRLRYPGQPRAVHRGGAGRRLGHARR